MASAKVDGASANVGVMLRRVRLTRTTLLDSLRGWSRVFLRLRTSAASKWELALRWAPSTVDPATDINMTVTHDTSNATSFGYVEKDMGYLMVPETGSLAGVALELWARRISGSGDLYLDLLRLLPATPNRDVLTRIVVPGGSIETWLGSELVTPVTNPAAGTAGTISGTTLLLDTTTDNAGTPPNTGFAWPVGRHRVTFRASRTTSSSTVAVFRVRNITDSTDAIAEGHVWPAVDYVKAIHLEFDAVAGKSYQPQVDDPTFANVRIHDITHHFIPALAQNEQAYTDPEQASVVKRNSSGNILVNLSTEGEAPFWLPPGLTVLFAIPLDVPKAGYTESESVKARTVTLSAAGSPRYTG